MATMRFLCSEEVEGGGGEAGRGETVRGRGMGGEGNGLSLTSGKGGVVN